MKKTKEEKVKKTKKKNNVQKEKFLSGVKSEVKKVVWPDKKDVVKYTIATLIFCIILMAFFQLLDLGLSVIKGVFK